MAKIDLSVLQKFRAGQVLTEKDLNQVFTLIGQTINTNDTNYDQLAEQVEKVITVTRWVGISPTFSDIPNVIAELSSESQFQPPNDPLPTQGDVIYVENNSDDTTAPDWYQPGSYLYIALQKTDQTIYWKLYSPFVVQNANITDIEEAISNLATQTPIITEDSVFYSDDPNYKQQFEEIYGPGTLSNGTDLQDSQWEVSPENASLLQPIDNGNINGIQLGNTTFTNGTQNSTINIINDALTVTDLIYPSGVSLTNTVRLQGQAIDNKANTLSTDSSGYLTISTTPSNTNIILNSNSFYIVAKDGVAKNIGPFASGHVINIGGYLPTYILVNNKNLYIELEFTVRDTVTNSNYTGVVSTIVNFYNSNNIRVLKGQTFQQVINSNQGNGAYGSGFSIVMFAYGIYGSDSKFYIRFDADSSNDKLTGIKYTILGIR